MHQVVIDGTPYLPADAAPSVGIGVTTRNRPDALATTLKHLRTYLPPAAKLVIVDDASDKPVDDADHRFDDNVGIAVAKNKCLELLYDSGCEHIFLFDNDTYPIADEWWKPYVESPEPHLMWIFDKPAKATKRQVEILYRDDQHVAYHATRGCLLYVERRVLDTVGGMDPAFGLGGWEHQSWSDRIHAAGLTTWRYADVVDSADLIHSMDQHGEVESTWTAEARRFSEGPGMELRMRSRHSPEFIEFRERRDVVVTTLLTSQVDPQRGKPMKADPALLKKLHDSLTGELVVLHTDLPDTASKVLPKADLVRVTQHINPYFERWVRIYQYLRDHPEIGRVWCVDGTDVQMTRDPFPEMEPGVLYAGYEPTTLRDEWMVKHHPDTTLQEFMKANPNLPLVNAGVVGGDRDTVMAVAQAIGKMFFDDHIDWIYGWEHGRVNDQVSGDMGVFQYVVRTRFGDQLSSGPHVTNVFKSNVPSKTAWWQHK